MLYLSKICARNKSSNLNLQLPDAQTLFKEAWARVKLLSWRVPKPTTRGKKRNIRFIMNQLWTLRLKPQTIFMLFYHSTAKIPIICASIADKPRVTMWWHLCHSCHALKPASRSKNRSLVKRPPPPKVCIKRRKHGPFSHMLNCRFLTYFQFWPKQKSTLKNLKK